MRLFIAIELDDRVKNAISSTAGSLAFFGEGSFCPKDSYHITLAFLGETENIDNIKKAMNLIEALPFYLSTKELENFGNTYFVSVSDNKALNDMQTQLTKVLKENNVWFDEKPFKPHITIVRRFKKQDEPFVFVPQATFEVKEISLMATVGAGVYKSLYKKAL
ncbi:MAG: RNA 2',3'-cyclic phosphodiesterase [Clostridia bacterium]|nr:RNA 2',3'-cyclic phosphodiesterase [Clostridia bacterium]